MRRSLSNEGFSVVAPIRINNVAPFYVRQKCILLRAVEAMDLIGMKRIARRPSLVKALGVQQHDGFDLFDAEHCS